MAAFVTAAIADVDAVQRAGGSLLYFYETTTAKLIQLKLRGMEDIRRRADAWHSPTALQPVGTEVERQYMAARALLEDHKAGFGQSAIQNPAIHIQAGPGAIVQANSPGARAQVNIDVQAIRPALDDFEGALPWGDFEPAQVAEIRAEDRNDQGATRKGGTVVYYPAGEWQVAAGDHGELGCFRCSALRLGRRRNAMARPRHFGLSL